MESNTSKQDSSDEFFRIVEDFEEKTTMELVADVARSAELARVSALNANRTLAKVEVPVPVELKTDVLLALDCCENAIRSIAAFVGEIQ